MDWTFISHNVLWGIGFIVAHMVLFLLCYRFFGKEGLFAWIGVATVLANIQVVKTIEVFGIVTTLGNTIYATTFLATDLLNDKYGEATARKAVYLGLFTLVATTVMMQGAIGFIPLPEHLASHQAMETIFGFMPRLALASLTAYAVSQFLDVRIFSLIRRLAPRPSQLWIRSAGSTILSQIVDTTVFSLIAFWGVFAWPTLVQVMVSALIIKLLVTVLATPSVQWARRFGERTTPRKPSTAVEGEPS